MNFNQSLISLLAIILFQIGISQAMEVKAILDEKTLHQLNLLFLQDQKKRKQQAFCEYWAEIVEPFITPRVEKMLPLDMSLDKQLELSILSGDLSYIAELISRDIYLNQKFVGNTFDITFLNLAIERANRGVEMNWLDKEVRFKIIELLIQHGANINQKGEFGLTALEKAMSSDYPKIPIIKLLLGYGAIITEKAVELAKSKVNSQELLKLFDLHTRVLKQAENNPTEELLGVTITFNKPFVVQLIATSKPKLVTLEHLKLAQEKCPAALPHLNKIFKLVKLKKFAKGKALPNEINQLIQTIVNKNL